MLEREILLLEVLRHQSVVGFVDACITDTVPRQMSLYMEYCDLGSLQKMIKRYTDHNNARYHKQQHPLHVPEAFIWHVLHSLASALQYLHYGIAGNDRRDPPCPKSLTEWPPILHRDIKPDNILLRTAPGASTLHKDPSQPAVYPHWPFNDEDPEGGDRTYPKVVLADFVSAVLFLPFLPLNVYPFQLPDYCHDRELQLNTTNQILTTLSLPHFTTPRPNSQKLPFWAMFGLSAHQFYLFAGVSLLGPFLTHQRTTRTNYNGIGDRNADARWPI